MAPLPSPLVTRGERMTEGQSKRCSWGRADESRAKPEFMKRNQSHGGSTRVPKRGFETARKSSSRREFLRVAAKGLSATALFGGLPSGWIGSVYADDSPEAPKMKFGIIALTHCSPILI